MILQMNSQNFYLIKTKLMDAFNKEQIKKVLDYDLTIHWWNCRSKTLDYDGTVKEYLKRENITYKTKVDNDSAFERVTFTVKFDVGSLTNISYSSRDLSDCVRMAISIRLTYLGDKAKFRLQGRERTINF